MRLDLKTEKKKPINIHFLFSPDDPNHEGEIERILSQLMFEFRERKYHCTLGDLAMLGRAFDPKQTDEGGAIRAGANQFKVTLQDLRELFRSEAWLRNNCLVAVAGGMGDGTAGLQEDDSFAAMRRELETFAHIIFASTPSQRDFWLGKKGTTDRSFIEHTYGYLKPCLHGSDAHREEKVAAPDLERYCWIKGDPTFETLRQAVIEPEERVWLGPTAPAHNIPSVVINRICVTDAPWLHSSTIELNSGLVAVIGARGSGKTALVDMIASGANSIGPFLDESSFLKRASSPVNYLKDAQVQITWGDGNSGEARLQPPSKDEEETYGTEDVCYLSQHFVNRLCSSGGLATELRHEMERIVFNATDPTNRLEADSFEELADILLDPVRRRREEIQNTIISKSEAIIQEDLRNDRLPILQKNCDSIKKQIERDRKELAALIPKGKQERAQKLNQLEQACTAVEAKVENLRRRYKALDDLAKEVAHIRNHIEPHRYTQMRELFSGAGLSTPEWNEFGMAFKGDVDTILAKAKNIVDGAITIATEGDPKSPADTNKAHAEWPLKLLKGMRDEVKKEVGIDVQKQKKYETLQKTISQQEVSLQRLETEIKESNDIKGRRDGLIESRRTAYTQVFDTFAEEERTLEHLYAPLRHELASGTGTLSKLQFIIRRRVDLDTWISRGEELLDLRKETRFRGHGALRKIASEYLFQAWKEGATQQVATAMDAFRREYQNDLVKAMPTSILSEQKRVWTQSLATWLFDTTHVHIEYGIQYDGVDIEQLSPGTRGIVLLLLYLAIDREDRRPLIIDQPEENLDPNSVFEELVPHFREARKRRQIIVVTHNANLVVNTDADQVIVAKSSRSTNGGLPIILYRSGSLENAEIRQSVCEILEGGERAFLERERRYRLRWNDTISVSGLKGGEHKNVVKVAIVLSPKTNS